MGKGLWTSVALGLAVVSCSAKIGAPTKGGRVSGSSAAYLEAGAKRSESTFGAAFARAANVAPLGACARSVAADRCTILTCDDAGGAPSNAAPAAGTITVRVAARTVTLAPADDHTYPAFEDPTTAFWSGGETLSIDASGGEVPPFSGTVVAPPSITVTAPDLPPGVGRVLVDRASDLPVTWAPIAGDAGPSTIEVTISGAGTASARAVVTCSFDASAGSAAIPAKALAGIQAGEASLSIATRRATRVIAGDWAVELQADTYASAPDGRRFAGIATVR